MLIRFICWIWGHSTTAIGHDIPAVITDSRLFKGDVPRQLAPNSVGDVNLSMLPPGLSLSGAFFVGPSFPRWQRLAFCKRCGKDTQMPQVFIDQRLMTKEV